MDGLQVIAFSIFLLVSSVLVSADEKLSELERKSFVTENCIRCHGAKVQKGDRRFDRLRTDLSDHDNLSQWQEILDAINRGDMPPKGESKLSPSDTKRFVAGLTQKLEAAYAQHADKRKPLFRRLNRHEYRNTIRDLCGVNTESFDPTTSFPADQRVDGFENIGDKLVLSDFLMQRYLEAASLSIKKASQTNGGDNTIHKVFQANDLETRKFQFRPQIMFQVNVDGKYVDVGHGDRKSDRVVPNGFDGVPVDGYYTIRVKAEGINRKHPYAPELLGVDPNEPIKMELLVADPTVGNRLAGNVTDRSIAIVPLKDHEAELYEYRVWMDKGFVPIVRYINGPQPIKGRLLRLAPLYHADVLPSNWRSGTDDKPAEPKERYLSDVYQGPRMRIHRMEIEGPESVALDQNRRAALFGKQATAMDTLDSQKVIEQFLFRAFRRPPLASEVERFRDFNERRQKLGETAEVALMTTFKAILCSPSFVYIEMPIEKSAAELRQFRIASRLSYFLWSSMPDEELFELAANSKLEDPKVLVAQITRMLKDPRAKVFTEHFTDSWLRLNELGSMPPDTGKFKRYYERQLQDLMKRETQSFFDYVLSNNLGIEYFIDSKFTFVNRYLANHYGIPGIVGDEFRKVELPTGSLRGGLLGQASVLTVTSNGVETSPVKRGIWVLENLLGTPPSPPPPDVNPLEPDIRGATTIREQLEKHRSVETCAECHRKIDPIGFAMEAFDPIGSFRTKYVDERGKDGREVDTSGRLVTGEEFAGLVELKRLLLARKDQVARCLAEKMLTYAMGRELRLDDRPQVDAIVKSMTARGHGLRDLVDCIVTSESFRE